MTIERPSDGSPERLWAFWTDPEKFATWFNPAPGMDLVIHEYNVRPGGHVRFDMPQPDGDRNPQEGVFQSLRPYRELVTGAADKSSLITVRFEPVGARTRMVVTVTGVPSEFHEDATRSWNAGFEKLAGALDTEGEHAGVTSGRGFTIECTLKAPPSKVWEMWTTKAGLERWFILESWASTVTRLELGVGGRYEITSSDGQQTVRNHGTYTEIMPMRRLAYIWNFDIFLAPGEKPYDVPITIEIREVPGGTRMTFTQGPLATPESTEGSWQGVLSTFEKLKKALEV